MSFLASRPGVSVIDSTRDAVLPLLFGPASAITAVHRRRHSRAGCGSSIPPASTSGPLPWAEASGPPIWRGVGGLADVIYHHLSRTCLCTDEDPRRAGPPPALRGKRASCRGRWRVLGDVPHGRGEPLQCARAHGGEGGVSCLLCRLLSYPYYRGTRLNACTCDQHLCNPFLGTLYARLRVAHASAWAAWSGPWCGMLFPPAHRRSLRRIFRRIYACENYESRCRHRQSLWLQ